MVRVALEYDGEPASTIVRLSLRIMAAVTSAVRSPSFMELSFTLTGISIELTPSGILFLLESKYSSLDVEVTNTDTPASVLPSRVMMAVVA